MAADWLLALKAGPPDVDAASCHLGVFARVRAGNVHRPDIRAPANSRTSCIAGPLRITSLMAILHSE
jgi:hypothetical protein